MPGLEAHTPDGVPVPKAIEAAQVDDGVKLLAGVLHANASADRVANQKGHADTASAIRQQTFAFGLGAFIAFLVLLFMFGQSRGVDVGATADAVKSVTTSARALAEGAPAVAGSAAQPE